MPGGAPINGAAARSIGILRHVWRRVPVAHLLHEISRVVALVGSTRIPKSFT